MKDNEPRQAISALKSPADKDLGIKSPVEIGQTVYVVKSYRGWYPIEGPCPSCEGAGHLLAKDGIKFPCGREGTEDGVEWHCFEGERRTRSDEQRRVYEAEVTLIEVQWWGPDNYLIKARLAWWGGSNGNRREAATMELNQFFLTREEAEADLALSNWYDANEDYYEIQDLYDDGVYK